MTRFSMIADKWDDNYGNAILFAGSTGVYTGRFIDGFVLYFALHDSTATVLLSCILK